MFSDPTASSPGTSSSSASSPSPSTPSASGRAATNDRLLSVLKTAAAAPDQSGEALREAVFDYVAQVKGQRFAPQEVLIALKAHVQRAAGRSIEQSDYQELVARVVQWGIEEYYRGR